MTRRDSKIEMGHTKIKEEAQDMGELVEEGKNERWRKREESRKRKREGVIIVLNMLMFHYYNIISLRESYTWHRAE